MPVVAEDTEEPAEQQQTADAEFQNAYLLLTQADKTRDSQHFSLAIELYRRALDAYIKFADRHPDWQPGVVRFRLTYCDNQLKALLENVKSGKIVLLSPYDTAHAQGSAGRALKDRSAAASIAGAKLLLAEGKPATARIELLKALKADPDSTNVRILIGIAQCETGQYDDAVFLMENMVKETPENTDAHVVLGTAYFGLRRESDAIAMMKKALELNPSHKEAHFNMAQMLLTVKPPDIEKARHHYSKAVSLGVNTSPELDAILK